MNRLREKTTATLLIAIFMISAMVVIIPALGTTIDEGVLTYAAGHYLEDQPLKVGYDIFGYNYQGHMFKGTYANSYLGKDGFPPYEGDTDAYLAANPDAANTWYWPYRDVKLKMKWNDAWISNEDNNADGILDRHYGHDSYIGSGAWLTNHQSGKDIVEDETIKWTYFTKIVAAPGDAYVNGGLWYTSGDAEIGPVIWGQFATIQSVYNEQGGPHGIEYLSPASPGFGDYEP